MKLRSNVITGFAILSFFLGGIGLQAQGIYSDKTNKEASTTTTQAVPNNGGGGLFRSDDGDWGSDGNDGQPAPGEDSPIGGGILILSLLSGGYALVKRNLKNKNEK
jgi:hypothetical protein